MRTVDPKLSTIGYESADLSDFIKTLQIAGITRLIDVRELPISRRKGFAKKALSSALALAGIEYVHLKGLGDPKDGREAARTGDYSKFRKIFYTHMSSNEAQLDLGRAAEMAINGTTCLMCYERDHNHCHRAIVAQALTDLVPLSVRHLGVRPGLSKVYA